MTKESMSISDAVKHLQRAYKLISKYPSWDDNNHLTPAAGVRAHVEEAYKCLTGEKFGEEGSVSPRLRGAVRDVLELRGAVRDVLDYLEVDDLGEEDPQAKELRAAFDAEKTPK